MERATRWLLGVFLLLLGAACSGDADGAAPLLPGSELAYEIEWATYFGGPRTEEAREIIVYPDGSALVGLQTKSKGLPTHQKAFQRTYAGDDPDAGHPGIHGGDLFFLRLSADGSRMLAGSYFGGSRQERSPYGMELDADGNVVFATLTRSPDWPTTAGGLQRQYGGGSGDWGVGVLSPDLSKQVMGTFIGGSDGDTPRGGLDVGPDGRIHVVGTTASADFPISPGPLLRDPRGGSAAVVTLERDGSLAGGVLIGGSGGETIVGIRVGADGVRHLGGYTDSPDFPVTPGSPQTSLAGEGDLFIAALAPDGELLRATFHGGTGQEYAEHRVFAADDGTTLMPGYTESRTFPTTEGALHHETRGKADATLSRLSADGTRFEFATLVGGSGVELMLMPVPDARGRITFVGQSQSHDFPITQGALQETHAGGRTDGVITVFRADGERLLYASFLGGSDEELVRGFAYGPDGSIFLVGKTASKDFPVTEGAFQTHHGGATDAFVVKLVPVTRASGAPGD